MIADLPGQRIGSDGATLRVSRVLDGAEDVGSSRQRYLFDTLFGESTRELADRLMLVYTGQQRLTKNLLRAVMGGLDDPRCEDDPDSAGNGPLGGGDARCTDDRGEGSFAMVIARDREAAKLLSTRLRNVYRSTSVATWPRAVPEEGVFINTAPIGSPTST